MTISPNPSSPSPGAPRWMRVLLVLSLALNLLVAGLLIGDALTGGGPGRGPRPAEMALGPVAQALDPADRRAILGTLRGNPGLRPLGREERIAGLQEIAAVLDIGVEAVESRTARGRRALTAIRAGRSTALCYGDQSPRPPERRCP